MKISFLGLFVLTFFEVFLRQWGVGQGWVWTEQCFSTGGSQSLLSLRHFSVAKICVIIVLYREAPWSNGERCGLVIQAMVLEHGLESQPHLTTRWKDGPLDGRKIMKDNKDSQMGQVTTTTKNNSNNNSIIRVYGSSNCVSNCFVDCQLPNVENHWFVDWRDTHSIILNCSYHPRV